VTACDGLHQDHDDRQKHSTAHVHIMCGVHEAVTNCERMLVLVLLLVASAATACVDASACDTAA
jgi:hypothetical protein